VYWGRDSSVGAVTRLRDGRSGFRIPVTVRNFRFRQMIQTSYGADPSSYSMDSGLLFQG
jgi:hypothetical protein